MADVSAINVSVKTFGWIDECLYPIVSQSLDAHIRSMHDSRFGRVFYIRRVRHTNTSADIEIYSGEFPAEFANGAPRSRESLQWDLDRDTWKARLTDVVSDLMRGEASQKSRSLLTHFIPNRKVIIIVGVAGPRGDTIKYVTFPPANLKKNQTLAEYTLPKWKSLLKKIRNE